jgi:hypothetical protein
MYLRRRSLNYPGEQIKPLFSLGNNHVPWASSLKTWAFPQAKFVTSWGSCIFHHGTFLTPWGTCFGVALSFLLHMEVTS